MVSLRIFSWLPPTQPRVLGSTQPLKVRTRDFSWGKLAGAYGSRPTTLVMPKVKKIQGLNLPRTSWVTSAGCWMIFTFTLTTMATNLQAKRHIFLSLNPATSRSHSVSAPALSLFNEANFKILSPTEGFSRYECNSESPSAD